MEKSITQKQDKQKAFDAKKIALDNITEDFLNSLQSIRNSLNVSLDSLSEGLNIKRKTITEYEKRRRTPTLITLVRLAELLNVDISGSINYQFFHRKIHSCNIIKQLQSYGLTPTELSAITGYSPSAIRKTIRFKHGASVICLHTIMQALDEENKNYAIRQKLTSKSSS